MGFIVDLFTADQDRRAQTRAADRAADVSQNATDQSIALQRDMFNRLWDGTQVQREAGDAATRMMAQLMGLNLPSSPQAPQAPQTQPPVQPGTSQPATSPGVTGTAPIFAGGGGDVVQPDVAVPQRPTNALMDGGEQPGRGGGMLFPNQNQIGEGNALNLDAGPQFMPENTAGPQVLPRQPGAATPATPGAATPNAFNTTDWLRSTPGYQFNFDEGARAMNTRLAGQGRLQSGDASREAIRYGQNYGDRIYADQYNRLAGIAGLGQTAQSQGQSAGTNFANNGSNALQWNANNAMQSSYNRGNAQSGFWGSVGGSVNNMENMAMRFMGGF